MATSASAVTIDVWPTYTIGCGGCGENGYRGARGGATWRGGGMSDCSSDLPCPRHGSRIDTLFRERSCTVKNRMRELRSCGTVRDEGREVLVYSDPKPVGGGSASAACHPTLLAGGGMVGAPDCVEMSES